MDKNLPRQTLRKLLNGSKTLAHGMWADNIVRVLLAIAVGFFALSVVKGCHTTSVSKEYEKKMAAWKQERDSAIKFSDSVRVHNIHLLVEVDRLEGEVGTLKAENRKTLKQVNQERLKNDSLLAEAASLPDTCKVAIDAAIGYRNEADRLRGVIANDHVTDSLHLEAIRNLKVGNAELVAANDSLKKVILKVPVYKEPKMFGVIPYPSRKQSFVAGVVTTVVVLGAAKVYFHQ